MFSLFELLTQNAMAIGNALAGNRRTLVIFSFYHVISGDSIFWVLVFETKIVTDLIANTTHRRTGRGGEGGCSPPKFWATRIFLGSERKFGQNQFFKTFPCFLNHCFEEINIFYCNLKLA